MKPQVLTGSKSQIAEMIARIDGEIREAIVFVEEPSDSVHEQTTDDIFAEMEPFTVKAEDADCSRQSIYSRLDSE